MNQLLGIGSNFCRLEDFENLSGNDVIDFGKISSEFQVISTLSSIATLDRSNQAATRHEIAIASYGNVEIFDKTDVKRFDVGDVRGLTASFCDFFVQCSATR